MFSILKATTLCAACATFVVAGSAAPVSAAASPAFAEASNPVPQRQTLLKLTRRITIDFQDQQLGHIMEFLQQFSGADIEPLWKDERNAMGLDREQTITLKVTNVSLLTLIERVLEKAETDDPDGCTWQLSEHGEFQVGPRERLNKFRRIQIYDINDLLMTLPDYDEVPQIDLQSALQQSRGGGGQSPFRNDQQEDRLERRTLEERANEIVDLILELVEPEQWQEAGGRGGSLRHWRGSLIVNAPDYMHRQINGYPYWPSANTRATMVNGRRYVSLNLDTGIAKLEGFGNQPVTAVVGGQLVTSRPGGGG